MNELIQFVAEQRQSTTYYNMIGTVGLVIALLYSLFHATKFKIKLWKAFIIIAVVCFGQMGLQSIILPILQYIRYTHFLGINTAVNSIVRTFVFLPIIALPLAKIFKYKFGRVCDAIVMFPLLRSAIAQIACIFPGCCAGYEWEYGIYNIKTEHYHFPTPILETILTLIIFAYLVYRTHKKKYVSDGTLYPLMMVLYGIMRFICEMLRDNEKIFIGINALGLHAIFMCLVGLIVLYLIKKKKVKAQALEFAVAATAETVADEEQTKKESAPSDVQSVPIVVKQKTPKKSKKRKNANKRKTKIKKKKKKKK